MSAQTKFRTSYPCGQTKVDVEVDEELEVLDDGGIEVLIVGYCDGTKVGETVGWRDGCKLGMCDGDADGFAVDGAVVGSAEGPIDGANDGPCVGYWLGPPDEVADGLPVGDTTGLSVCKRLGSLVGDNVDN